MIAILYKFASQLVKNNEIGRFPMVYPFMFTGLLRKTDPKQRTNKHITYKITFFVTYPYKMIFLSQVGFRSLLILIIVTFCFKM